MRVAALHSIVIDLLLIGTVYLITNYQEVSYVIQSYRIQSVFVALTVITESRGRSIGLIVGAGALPLLLGIFIEWFLQRATVFIAQDARSRREAARRIWRTQKVTDPRNRKELGVNLLLVILLIVSAVTSSKIIRSVSINFDELGLFISLFLYLAGLYNTTHKRNIISQTIGMLTMDHGLYLAIFKLVDIPALAISFVISLYAYMLITLVVLLIIIPQVRRESGSLDLTEIADQSSLEG